MEKRGLSDELAQAGVTAVEEIVFADEMRVGLIGEVRRRWVPQGYKLEQVVEYEYEWAYLTLAVNGLTGTLLWDWTENRKGASIAPIVRQGHAAGIEAVVWDGAQGHRGEAYQDGPVVRIEQPAYSPQLNPAERVFQYLRSQIEGQIYGSVEAKKQAVEAELNKLAANPAQVKSLTGWDWIRHACADLSTPSVASR